jgi:NAD(P)-dependent dehydrogenase (short-subunit alcohol dehydrogenase family)
MRDAHKPTKRDRQDLLPSSEEKKMTRRFNGKVAIVTGAGDGIGRETALSFAREGAAVVVADIREPAAAETVRLIEADGGKALAATVDVTKSDQVEAMVKSSVSAFGHLDILFNNAGLVDFSPMCDLDESRFDAVMAVNVKGVWLGMKYAIPAMVKNGGGAIVNACSVSGLVAVKNCSAYVASKHAVAGLTKIAAIEYGMEGVRINAVAPGATATAMNKTNMARFSEQEWATRMRTLYPGSGRLAEPREIAQCVLFLCSDDASFINGAILAADGAYTAQ